MTAAPRDVRRSGFTLVELLVAMAVMVTLASIALVVVPDALEQDRTTDGAATVRSQLMIAKARALRDNAPRGVRFLIGSDPNDPAKTNVLWSTELQHIEQPPPYLVNPNARTDPGAPYIEFIYTLATDGSIQPDPIGRKCFLRNVPPGSEPILLIQQDLAAGLYPRLYVSGLGSLYVSNLTASGTNSWEMQFNPSPWAMVDAVMGAGGSTGTGTGRRYYTFALYMSPRPLLGEPTIPLPKNICVDIPSSLPLPSAVGTDYDILFAPNGQVLHPGGTGQIFLWVRDYTKNGGKPSAYPSPPNPALPDFNQGGEQQIVALKTKSGSLGVYPVMFPPYAVGQDEYTFARSAR